MTCKKCSAKIDNEPIETRDKRFSFIHGNVGLEPICGDCSNKYGGLLYKPSHVLRYSYSRMLHLNEGI